MKKVLFVATVSSHFNSFHIPYLKWFKEKGYEVHIASYENEKVEYCDKQYNIEFERFPLKRNNIKAYKKLKRIIDENNYEIIHCHTPVGGVLTRIAARKARKKHNTKVIYTAHGFHFYKGAPLKNWIIYYPIEKICSRWTDCLITINTEDYEFAKKHFKRINNIQLVNGVGLNISKFNINIPEDDKEKLRKNLDIDNENIVLSYVAELNKNKNQILLINVMEELVREDNKYKLLLIGDGPCKSKYEEEIKEKKLINNIFLLGERKDIPQLLSVTDIYVASSIREGLPVNIMEAMYIGVPIVATDNRGHRSLIDNNKNGFIIYTKEQMIDSIKNIVLDENLKNKIKKAEKEKVQKYTINSVLDEMKKIYMDNINK